MHVLLKNFYHFVHVSKNIYVMCTSEVIIFQIFPFNLIDLSMYN